MKTHAKAIAVSLVGTTAVILLAPDRGELESRQPAAKATEVEAQERPPVIATNRPSTDLHEHMQTLPVAHRNQTLLMSVRDSGFECTEVVSSQLLGESWHAQCSPATLYRVRIDEFGGTTVAPVPAGDFRPGFTTLE